MQQLHQRYMGTRYVEVRLSNEAEARQAKASLPTQAPLHMQVFAASGSAPARGDHHREPSVRQWADHLGGSVVSSLPPRRDEQPRRDEPPPRRRNDGHRRSPPPRGRSSPPHRRSPSPSRRSPPSYRRSPPRDRRRSRSSSRSPARRKTAARRVSSPSRSPVRRKLTARRSSSHSPSPVRKKPAAARRSSSHSPFPVYKRPAAATALAEGHPIGTQETTKDIRSRGTLRNWQQVKGFGFIDCGGTEFFMHVSALRGIEEQDLADGICLEFTEAFNEAKGKSLAKNVTRPSDLRPSMKKLTTPGVPQPSADLLPMSDVRVRSLEELIAAKGRGTNEKSVSVQARPDANSKRKRTRSRPRHQG